VKDLQEYVQLYVRELSGPGAEEAWHSLVEAGPAALPYVVAAYDSVQDLRIRVSLIGVVCQYRVPQAIPFFDKLLRHDEPDIWKAAIDGLVALATEPAVQILKGAEANASGKKLDWIEEAVQQLIEARGHP
jgi:HEAT repeat protein